MTAENEHDFKGTGILRAAFEYQDLVAVDVLIDFLRDRHLYDWVQVEAEEIEFRAIDDVVTCKDGLFELTQVKFTPNPTNRQHRLSWEWLTKHKPKGTSLLQKWSTTTLRHIRDDSLARAALKTDRRPDNEFRKCMHGNYVVYDRLSSATKLIVDKQIGSPEAAVEFFGRFEFVHSKERLENLEENLRARLSYDTDNRGWAYFRERVRWWAIRKNLPRPDGRIKHHHLLQVFAPERPAPLPQDFVVPQNYKVPDEEFHRAFLEKTSTSDGISVLWGPPGRGKSTYLSHCVGQLRTRNDLVCIRHHYFLRISDRTEGRFSYFAIVESLKRQLADAGLPTGDANAGLSDALSAAALELTRTERRLVIIVDGLDHVWREAHDLTQMEELFGRLLPLPEGVRLVVGTQKVEDQYLPKRLLRSLPKGQWTELPPMSSQAVCDWLMSQWGAGRLPIEPVGHWTAEQLIEELASALHGISAGLPLHLVYSLETLLRAAGPILPESVDKLPVCPTGEIEDYYQSLWVRLSSGSRRVLHLLAGLQFGPPSYGLGSCLSEEEDWWTALEEVDHLLQHREASVVPFHASLFAFLRRQEEHADVFGTLVRNVATWLERDAPKYWRDAWLWVTQAQQGDASGLMKGPSREWAINWLASGYPVDQMIHILNLAEHAALDAQDLPRLIRLRTIKDKAVSAREYQTSEWGLFLETTLSFSQETELGAVLRDSIPELRTEELMGVVVSGPPELRQRMLEELNRRNAAPSANEDGRSWDVYADSVVRIVAREETEQADNVIEFAERTEAVGLIETYACESVRVGNFENVFAVGSRRAGYGLDRHTFAALCIECLGPGAKVELLAADRPEFQCLALLKGERSTCVVAEEDVSRLFSMRDEPGLAFSIRESGYDVFFSALAVALSGGVAEGRAKLGQSGEDTWLGQALRELERMAGSIGSGWRAARRWPSLGAIYRLFAATRPPSSSIRDQARFIGVRLALQDIAVDLCLIGTGILRHPKISVQDIRAVTRYPFWSRDLWLETYCERPLPLHSREGANALLDAVRSDLESRIVQFNNRAETVVRAARVALDHGLREVCGRELQSAADCLLGFVWHKDTFAFEVIQSLELLAKQGDADARNLFLSMAREIEEITNYTDGDQTRHAVEQFHRGIVELFPERVAKLYAHLIARQKWHRAERLAGLYAERLTNASMSAADRCLLETCIGPGEFNSAWASAEKMHQAGKSIQETLGRRAGRDGPIPDERTSSNTGEEESVALPDPSEFEPDRLAYFVRTTREGVSFIKEKPVVQWLKYWDSQGRSIDALAALERLFGKDGMRFDVTEALDTAFEISLREEGRSKAFHWLVRAQIENRGWITWWSSEPRFRRRVHAVATEYRGKWRAFVDDTSRIERIGGIEDNGVAVGMYRLVYFLVEVGQVELAKACAKEMVDVYRDEVSQQPLVTPSWAQ